MEQKATTDQLAEIFFRKKILYLSIIDREHKKTTVENQSNFIKRFHLKEKWKFNFENIS